MHYLFSESFDIRLASKPVINFCAAWIFSAPETQQNGPLEKVAFWLAETLQKGQATKKASLLIIRNDKDI